METTMGKGKDLVINALLYWQPVQLSENRRDVVRHFSARDDPCSCILHELESVEFLLWETPQTAVAVV
jgi:hypothetical protein